MSTLLKINQVQICKIAKFDYQTRCDCFRIPIDSKQNQGQFEASNIDSIDWNLLTMTDTVLGTQTDIVWSLFKIAN